MARYTDDFNRPDSDVTGWGFETANFWDIVNNQLRPGGPGGNGVIVYGSPNDTPDMYAEAEIADPSSTSIGVIARSDAIGNRFYLWRCDGSTWTLFINDNGNFIDIGAVAGTIAAGDVVRIECEGSTIRGYKNGVVLVEVTNTFIVGGNYAGLRSAASSTALYDNFETGDLGEEPAPGTELALPVEAGLEFSPAVEVGLGVAVGLSFEALQDGVTTLELPTSVGASFEPAAQLDLGVRIGLSSRVAPQVDITKNIPGFDADAVRAGLRLAMNVGLPVAPADQPAFYFPTPVVTSPATDSEGTPLAWDAQRDSGTTPPPVRVPCAIEYADSVGSMEGAGQISSSRLLLTLLDEDYEQVKGFAYVVVGGNAYVYERTQPPLGLVSVGVWQIWVRSADEG